MCFLFASWWRRYFVDHIQWDLMKFTLMLDANNFIHKNWMSCAGPLTLVHFMAKLAFRKIWTIFFPFPKISVAALPHTMISSTYCRCSRVPPLSSAVWISAWQMVALCFHPRSSRFQAYWTSLRFGQLSCLVSSSASDAPQPPHWWCIMRS